MNLNWFFHYSFMTSNRVTSLWTFLFVLSKLPELGDTLFIVLRKTPLTFLHCYHHVLTLVFCWYCTSEHASSGRWFTVMNTFVHSFMYLYYAGKAMKIRIPRGIAIVITCSQTGQMIVGNYVNYKMYTYLANNRPCGTSTTSLAVASFMYLSYLLLFIRFFYFAYIKNKKKDKKKL